LWLHSLKVAQLLHSAACLHTNQSRSYLNHLVLWKFFFNHFRVFHVLPFLLKTGRNYFILQVVYCLHSDLIYLGMCMNDNCEKCSL